MAQDQAAAPAPATELDRVNAFGTARIAVFRALQFGDLLCSVPALRALRRGAPGARITLIGLPWAESFSHRFAQYVDDFMAFPGHPALPERTPARGEFPAFLARVAASEFDLAIQMHGKGTVTNSIVASLGARRCAGFAGRGAWRPEGTFPDYPEPESEVWRWLRLVHALGGIEGDPALEWPVSEDERGRMAELAREVALGDDYVVLHPGASVPERCWAPERFAAVARALAEEGHPIVLTGTAPERDRATRVACHAGVPVVDLVERTDFGLLGALIERATLLVCNDTGVSHLAAALGTPSVVCFGPPDVNGWAPLDRQRHRVLYRPWGVTVEAVLDAARELLALRTPHAAP